MCRITWPGSTVCNSHIFGIPDHDILLNNFCLNHIKNFNPQFYFRSFKLSQNLELMYSEHPHGTIMSWNFDIPSNFCNNDVFLLVILYFQLTWRACITWFVSMGSETATNLESLVLICLLSIQLLWRRRPMTTDARLRGAFLQWEFKNFVIQFTDPRTVESDPTKFGVMAGPTSPLITWYYLQ